MKALIVIDFTRDFVTGSLPVGQPAVEIEETIAAITEVYCKNNHEVVMAVDLHEESDPYHPETALFPPHNIRGTEEDSFMAVWVRLWKNANLRFAGWIKQDTAHSAVRIWSFGCVNVE